MVHKRIVLMLEHDPGRRARAAALLSSAGHALVVATDAADAHTRLVECLPDAVVLCAPGGWDPAWATLIKASANAGAPVFVAEPSPPKAPPHGADGTLDLPLSDAGLQAVLRNVASRKAASFAAAAMDLDLDVFAQDGVGTAPALVGPPTDEATSLTGPDETAALARELAASPPGDGDSEALQGPHEPTPAEGTPVDAVTAALSDEAASPNEDTGPQSEKERTNVGDEPGGLREAVTGVTSPAAEEDVFASGDAATPPAGRPDREPEDTDANRHAPALTAAAVPSGPSAVARPHALPAPERAPTPPGRPLPRVLKLDAPRLPVRFTPSSAPREDATALDESLLGADATRRLCALHAQLDHASHYELLGVAQDVTDAVLEEAFLHLSRLFHPDRTLLLASGPLKDVTRAVYQRITHAMGVLRDPADRAAYDARLEGKAPAPPPPAAEDDGESAFSSAPATPPPPAAPAPPPPTVVRASKPASEPPPARPSVMVDLDASPLLASPPVPVRKDTRETPREDPASGFEDSPSGVRAAMKAGRAPPPQRIRSNPVPSGTASAGSHTGSNTTNTSATTVGLNPLLVAATVPTMAASTVAIPSQTPPPAPAAPAAAAGDALTEDMASTPGGRKFVRLAVQALGRNDFNGARLNLTFALGYEPENQALKKRLGDVEGRLSKPPAR